jgi:hypothetical protein
MAPMITRQLILWPPCEARGKRKKLARPKRFELLTPRFVVWCSIQLSYGRFARRVKKPAAQAACDARHSYSLRRVLARRMPLT